MSARVVVAQRQTELVVVPGDERAADRAHAHRGGDGEPTSARGARRRYNHLFILWARFVGRIRALALALGAPGSVPRRVSRLVVPAAARGITDLLLVWHGDAAQAAAMLLYVGDDGRRARWPAAWSLY